MYGGKNAIIKKKIAQITAICWGKIEIDKYLQRAINQRVKTNNKIYKKNRYQISQIEDTQQKLSTSTKQMSKPEDL